MLMSPLALATVAALFVLGSPSLLAHGGVYRGPGTSEVPRVGGAGRPGTPRPTGPITPGQIPMPVEIHDQSWFVWWEYNKSPYFYRDRLVAGEAVSQGERKGRSVRFVLAAGYVEQTLVPLFIKILKRGSSNRELLTSSLIALARLRPKEDAIPTIARYLKRNQEYAETAALALGISGNKAALPILLTLAANKRAAGKWVRGTRVNYRTRSFALFGLGIWCRQTDDSYSRAKALVVVLRILQKEAKSRERHLRQDTEVAALHALRLIVSGSEGTSGDVLRRDSIGFLLDYIRDRKKADLLRSHAVSALGLALGRHADPTGKAKALLLKVLADDSESKWVHQSAVISLGFMGKEKDRNLLEQLDIYVREGKDSHARNLARIAMARIASDEARTLLLQRFLVGREDWDALALAMLDAERRKRPGLDQVDKTIGDALLTGSRMSGSTRTGSALSIAIGIQAYRPSIDSVAAAFDDKAITIYNAYVAESLGLLQAVSSQKKIKKLAERSLRHPGVFSKAILALGQLGTPDVGSYLGKLLRTRRYTVEKASVALALGYVGGVREADLLIRVVKNRNQEDLVRGFAAVALGIMGEPTKLPWYHHFLEGVNYVARTSTLTDGGKGVLEIL